MEIRGVDGEWLKISMDSLKEETLQDFFNAYIPSKRIQHQLICNKKIYIDSKPIIHRNHKLLGDCMRLKIYDSGSIDNVCLSGRLSLEIVYEDAFLLIINKPHRINIHSCGNGKRSLIDEVAAYCASRKYLCKPYPIHRLDKDTAGLIIFSKSKVFQPLFDSMISQKKFKRSYIAVVNGYMKKGYKTIYKEPIGKERLNSKKRRVDSNGKNAITHIESIYTDGKISVIKCLLETGRTHQIRVHLSYHNYPILNDSLYGVMSDLIGEMGLISYSVSFIHPILGSNIETSLDVNKVMLELGINDLQKM